jgi:hypothetical protein
LANHYISSFAIFVKAIETAQSNKSFKPFSLAALTPNDYKINYKKYEIFNQKNFNLI